MNEFHKYIDSLSEKEKIDIINGHEELALNGCIGESPIRYHTNKLMEKLSVDKSGIMIWMFNLAFECYRYFALILLNQRIAQSERCETLSIDIENISKESGNVD